MPTTKELIMKNGLSLGKKASGSEKEKKEKSLTSSEFSSLLTKEFKNINSPIREDISTTIKVKSGKAIFTEADINKTYNTVAKLLRMVFVDRDITTDEFANLHRLSCHPDLPNLAINTAKSNYMKTIHRDDHGNKLTFPKFQEIINIIGCDIMNVEVTLRDRQTGEIKSYQTVRESDII